MKTLIVPFEVQNLLIPEIPRASSLNGYEDNVLKLAVPASPFLPMIIKVVKGHFARVEVSDHQGIVCLQNNLIGNRPLPDMIELARECLKTDLRKSVCL